MYQTTTAVRKLAQLRKRIRGVSGGTSAGKTIGILELLIDDAQSDEMPTLTSVVSESLPHLKHGAIRDFLSILKTQGYYSDSSWNRTDFVYEFPNGSKIEFFGVDNADKVHGPRRDRLFVNEAINVTYEIVDQLMVRTREYIWLDWNPSEEFWWDTEIVPNRPNDFLILTYKDNEALDARIVADIEAHQYDANWWNIYGLGLPGTLENRIYKNWKVIPELPHEARLIKYGLDFGYSNDPTAIVAIYYHNGGYILEEICYQTAMLNKDIVQVFKIKPKGVIVADSAEPKSIDELRLEKLTVLPAQKGPDSVVKGIEHLQSLAISVTQNSTFLLKEYRQYLWERDKKTGKNINTPKGGDDHLLDAARYALESERPKKQTILNTQPAYESSDPYASPMHERSYKEDLPMRRPESWGPKSKFQQSGFESSMPGDNGI